MRAPFLALAILLLATPAAAEAPSRAEPVAALGWTAFSRDDEGGKRCWLATTPTRRTPAFAAAELRINFTAGTRELSLHYDGGDFPAPEGTLHLGTRRHALYFNGNAGWTDDPGAGADIERALAGGLRAFVTLGSERLDFRADGFRDALAEARALCGLP